MLSAMLPPDPNEWWLFLTVASVAVGGWYLVRWYNHRKDGPHGMPMYQARLITAGVFVVFAAASVALGMGTWALLFSSTMAVVYVALAAWDYSNRNKDA